MHRRDYRVSVIIGFSSGLFALVSASALGIISDCIWGAALVIGFGLLAPASLALVALVGRFFPKFLPFGKFAAVGTFNSFLDLAILNGLIFLSGIATGIVFTVWKTIAFVVAKNSSYAWNRWWVFESPREPSGREYGLFVLFTLIGGLLNVGSASLIVTLVKPLPGVSVEAWANVAAVVAIFISMLWNFFSYRNIVFKK